MSKKATAIVSYITIIGWLIAYLAGDKEGAKFHLNQSLVLGICGLLSGVISRIPVIGIIGGILGIVVFVFFVLGLIYAIQDEEKPLPIIGGIQILK